MWWLPKTGILQIPQNRCIISVMENPHLNGMIWGHPQDTSHVESMARHQVAFKSWHLYASHVTGSTSAMAFRLEGYHQGEWGSATWPLT